MSEEIPKLQRDAIYWERDQLVAALSKLFPAHLARHEGVDNQWSTIVCVHLPTGDVSWHIRRDERKYFTHLEEKPVHWDGHTTEEKYERLAKIEPTTEEITA